MRLIDKDELIKSLGIPEDMECYHCEWRDSTYGVCTRVCLSDVCISIENAEEVGRWIPCSERLPEYMEPVLTWDGGAYCVEKRIPVIRDSDTGEEIPGDWWVSDDYDEYESDYYPNLRDGACIAWMPMPEPWRGGGEDGNQTK